MRVVRQLGELGSIPGKLILAAGYFDGVHRGHQAVLRNALDAARSEQAEAWAMTMDPHPLRILRPDAAPKLLTCTAHKLHLLDSLGLHGAAILPFTRELAALEPDDFIAELCRAGPRLARIVVGPNWTFGRGARGTTDTLRALSKRHGFDVTVTDPVLVDGQPISSTRVREAVLLGQLAEAARLLGRPFSVRGLVVRGKQLGRRMGFPTANVDADSEVRPPAGIYAVKVDTGAGVFGGAAYLGLASPNIVEVHLIDQQLDLYGKTLDVAFIQFLRADRRFESIDALRAQIALDVDQARSLLRG